MSSPLPFPLLLWLAVGISLLALLPQPETTMALWVRDRRRLPAGDHPALVAHQARLHRRRVCDRHVVVCPPGGAVRTRVECVTRAGALGGHRVGSAAPSAGLPSPRAACAPSDATSLANGAAPGHAPRLVARSAYPPPEIAGLSPRSTGVYEPSDPMLLCYPRPHQYLKAPDITPGAFSFPSLVPHPLPYRLNCCIC